MQEEAEEEYKRLFPNHSDSFAAFERPPTAFSDMEVEHSETADADTVKSSAGQSLLRGRLLNEIVELQQRYVDCLPLYEWCFIFGALNFLGPRCMPLHSRNQFVWAILLMVSCFCTDSIPEK